MNIKISLTAKGLIICIVPILCGLIAWWVWISSSAKSRSDIKATCNSNCTCFNNVVDYRLTDNQAKSFALFMKNLNIRKDANALEFMDMAEIVAIQQAFAVCQLQAQPQGKPTEASALPDSQ